MNCYFISLFWPYVGSVSLTLKMKITHSSEMSVDFQRPTRRYITENRSLRNYHCENLNPTKCVKWKLLFPEALVNWRALFLLLLL
jgi:hypothetical protein